ncbi:protein hedgehog-like [Teleopsis dalmanni]|uniref:protein hedgehog-like n=1 Tax=Teleopsis dalmanni TaxID=139649 RepID=UPI0018CFACD4|nr:protein hedgehog-like [Teleopsis dalmanni]
MYTMDISERLQALGHNTNCCRKCQNQQQNSAQKYVTKASKDSMEYESPFAVCEVHNSASCDTTFTCQLRANKNGTDRNTSRQQNLSLRRLYALVLFLTLFATSYGCGPGRGIGGPRRSRKLTPLVVNEHMPMKSEKTHGASGLSEGVITRHSPKFKDLVMNYNTDIVFKDEEGTGADRLMSRLCAADAIEAIEAGEVSVVVAVASTDTDTDADDAFAGFDGGAGAGARIADWPVI